MSMLFDLPQRVATKDVPEHLKATWDQIRHADVLLKEIAEGRSPTREAAIFICEHAGHGAFIDALMSGIVARLDAIEQKLGN